MNMRLIFVVAVVALVVAEMELPKTLRVRLHQGVITGLLQVAGDGKFFYSFKGIPYAEPPLGTLRLRDSLGARGWSGVRNGSWDPPMCPQLYVNTVVGDENCLYLNVFTRMPRFGKNPVMVYIHGGGFVTGRAPLSPPLALMKRGVVLVVLQYRLGVLGFLSTEDSVMPGNLGLKDQTLALRWVHKNIRDMGGDPDKVTIFGDGAGAASVHYQILTPYTLGLFSRAIMQSGSSLCPRALRTSHMQLARHLAFTFSCVKLYARESPIDSCHLLRCVQNAPLNELVVAYTYFQIWKTFPIVTVPRVDGDYLPFHPATMLSYAMYRRVDLLIGYAQSEMSLLTEPMYNHKSFLQALKNEPYSTTSVVLGLDQRRNYDRLLNDSNSGHLKLLYSANSTQLAGIFTDGLVGVCVEDTALFHSAADPTTKVFLYQLRHQGLKTRHNTLHLAIDNHCAAGACLLDTTHYIFQGAQGYPSLTHREDLLMCNLVLDLWTNFATSGDPTPDKSMGWRWDAMSPTSFRYLQLGPTLQMLDDGRSPVRLVWHMYPTFQNTILFPNVVNHSMPLKLSQTNLDKMDQDDTARGNIVHKLLNNTFTNVLKGRGSLTCIIVEDRVVRNIKKHHFVNFDYSRCSVSKHFLGTEDYQGSGFRFEFLTCDVVKPLISTDCFKKAATNETCFIFKFYALKSTASDLENKKAGACGCAEGYNSALIESANEPCCSEKSMETGGSIGKLHHTVIDSPESESWTNHKQEGDEGQSVISTSRNTCAINEVEKEKKPSKMKLDCEFEDILKDYMKLQD